MIQTELLSAMADAASKGASAATVKLSIPASWIPWTDISTHERAPCAAVVLKVKVPTESWGHHVVVGAILKDGKLEWAYWCGDSFLEGSRTFKKGLTYPDAITETQRETIESQIETREGSLTPPGAKCNFWAAGQTCIHSHAALAWLHTNPQVLQAIEDLWTGAIPTLKGASGAASAAGAAFGWADPRAFLFTAAHKPLLFMGDRGAGKTTFCRQVAEETEAELIEVGLHEDVKASNLLGKLLPTGDGKFAWVDGPLTKAFRKASKGQRVLLLLDELLRTPQEHLSILLTSLSPYKGKCKLATSRVVGYDEDGVGIEEVLTCEARHLGVVATTNVGIHYVIGEIDPALQERFVVFKMDTEETLLRKVLEDICNTKGLPTGLADKLILFWKGMSSLARDTQIQFGPTLRVLARSLERVNSATELKSSLLAEKLQWCGLDSDGVVIESHVKAVEDALRIAKL